MKIGPEVQATLNRLTCIIFFGLMYSHTATLTTTGPYIDQSKTENSLHCTCMRPDAREESVPPTLAINVGTAKLYFIMSVTKICDTI